MEKYTLNNILTKNLQISKISNVNKPHALAILVLDEEHGTFSGSKLSV